MIPGFFRKAIASILDVGLSAGPRMNMTFMTGATGGFYHLNIHCTLQDTRLAPCGEALVISIGFEAFGNLFLD